MAEDAVPQRIQRKRTKGWKMPPNCVYVGRPTKWGNPFKLGDFSTRKACVDRFREFVGTNLWTSPTKHEIREQLKGKDLSCFCPLDQPCHADVLLEIANG